MTEPIHAPGTTLQPFDLRAPASLLFPGPSHDRQTDVRAAKLGTGDEAAVVEVLTWGKCRPGCRSRLSHEAGTSVTLRVPCPDRVHCPSCEGGDDGHVIRLSDEQVRELKGILP